MSQIHARICQYKPRQCQIISFNLSECISRKPVEKPQSEIIDAVITEVCERYNVTLEQLQVKTRRREIVLARQIAMYFLKKYTKLSLNGIGEIFGGFDHTTSIYAIHTVNDLKATDPDYSHSLTQLETKIKYKI